MLNVWSRKTNFDDELDIKLGLFLVSEMETKIEKFDPFGDPQKIGQEWLTWRENFQMFLMTKGNLSEDQKLANLLLAAGTEVQRMYRMKKEAVEDTDSEGNTSEYVEALVLLDRMFIHQKNDSFQRTLFRRMIQEPNEPIASYVSRLKQQVQFCGYKSDSEMEIAVKDQVIERGNSDKLRQEIWKEDRDLNGILEVAQALENAELYQRSYAKEVKRESSEVSWVADAKRRKPNDGNSTMTSNTSSSKCWACGRSGHMKRDPNCAARNLHCLKCNKKGHFSVCCRLNQASQSSRQSQQQRVNNRPHRSSNVRFVGDDEELGDTEYILNVTDGQTEYVTCDVGGVQIKMLIDSGTMRNLIPLKIWQSMKLQRVKVKQEISGSDVTLKAYGQSSPIEVHGRFKAELKLNNITSDQWFYIVMKGEACLLGSATSKKHDVLKTGENVNKISSEKFPKIEGKNFMELYDY